MLVGGAGSFSALAGVRAVLFDVYGTLLVSASGDIGVGSDYRRGSLDALASAFTDPPLTGEELKAYFREAVLEEHVRLFPTVAHPEVRVEELWARCPGLVPGTDPAELALRFECEVNPCWPMPGAAAAVSALGSAGIVLGVVSNAQFYTPLYFDALFGSSLDGLGFDPDLRVYSCDLREAKPSPAPYAAARDVLAARGFRPDEVLFVGNDLFNDAYAASCVGFRTCLFAGDRRSLRLRQDNRICRGFLPDAVVRRLADVLALVGAGGA